MEISITFVCSFLCCNYAPLYKVPSKWYTMPTQSIFLFRSGVVYVLFLPFIFNAISFQVFSFRLSNFNSFQVFGSFNI